MGPTKEQMAARTTKAASSSTASSSARSKSSGARAKTTTATSAADLDELFERARAALGESGVYSLAKVKSKEAREALRSRLVTAGFEVSQSTVRRPLEAQLRDAVAHRATVAVKSLGSHVRGAKATEIKKAVEALARKGEARVVLRAAVETLTSVD